LITHGLGDYGVREFRCQVAGCRLQVSGCLGDEGRRRNKLGVFNS